MFIVDRPLTWVEGYLSGRRDRPTNDNPYEDGTDNSKEFIKGWKTGTNDRCRKWNVPLKWDDCESSDLPRTPLLGIKAFE